VSKTLDEKLKEIERRNSYYFKASVFKIATGEDCAQLLTALRLCREQRDLWIERDSPCEINDKQDCDAELLKVLCGGRGE